MAQTSAGRYDKCMSEDWDEDGDPWIVKGQTRPFENEWFRIDANGDVHLVGQWRFPLGRYSWEIPEGGAEPGEAPLACAKRELEEETGLSVGFLHGLTGERGGRPTTDGAPTHPAPP